MAAVGADEEASSLLQGDATMSSPAEAPEALAMGEPAKQEVCTLVREGNFTQAAKQLEADPAKWLEADSEGHSVLHWAALAGKVDFVEQALAAGVAADVSSKNGQTPFMWAAIKGHIDAARVLMKAGADPQARDSLGATPMILAVQYRQHSLVLLLMCRAPPEKLLTETDSKGCTAVHWAAYKGDIATLRLFVYFEANFKVVDGEGMTPLHRAVQSRSGDHSVMKLLLENEVNPLVRDHEGRTCLTIAEDNKDLSTAYVLKKILEKSGFKTDDLAKKSLEAQTLGAGEVADVEAGGVSGKEAERKAKAKKEKDFVNDIRGKALQYIAPCFWLVSVSLAVFQYLTDLRSMAWESSPIVCLGFELGVPMSLALFFYTSLSDPGKVPPGIKSASGVEELMKALDTAAVGSGDKLIDAHGRRLDFGRLCTTTFILKGLRMKYCTQTGACVDEFDHFCGWLNVAIGRGNHRPFIALAAAEVTTQMCHLCLLVHIAFKVVTYESLGQWLSTLLITYPMLCLLLMLQGFTTPGILMLLMQQLRLISINMTTNEIINCQRYEHFWDEKSGEGSYKQKVFVNPFDKGNAARNCMDFWWTRRRGEERTQVERSAR